MDYQVPDFKQAADLAVFIRDKMDEHLGKQLPEGFIAMFMEIIDNPQYRKMVFRGDGYTKVFVAKLRENRIARLTKSIPDLPELKEV